MKIYSLYRFILFSLVLAVIIFVVENINHRFWLNDFRVYYYAAEALLKGQQVYGLPFGLDTGFYKYSPFALFFFIPYTLLPYYAASVIHFFVISICFIVAVIIIWHIITTYLLPIKIKSKNLLLSIINICVLLHVVREQKLGNVNIILVLLISAALLFILRNMQGRAGLLLGIVIMFKPYLIVLLLPLLFHKKFRALTLSVATILASLLAPVLVLGLSKNIELHKEWLHAMQAHSTYLSSNQTLQSLIKNNMGLEIPAFGYIIAALIFAGYLLLFWMGRNNDVNKNPEIEKKQFIFQYFILLSIIPNLLITDTEQFLYSLPLIIIVISYVWSVKKRNYFFIAFLVFAILLYGGNSSDLLGKDLSGLADYYGLLGFSNLCIIGLVIYLYIKSISDANATSGSPGISN